MLVLLRMKGVIMSNKTILTIKVPSRNFFEINRSDWGETHPSTKIHEDKRNKQEKKYPKQFQEKFYED